MSYRDMSHPAAWYVILRRNNIDLILSLRNTSKSPRTGLSTYSHQCRFSLHDLSLSISYVCH